MRTERRLDYLFAVVVTVVVTATWLPRLHGPIDLRWDGGVYYVLGTSLAEGRGYRLLNEPGEIRADQYPPLWPGLIAAEQQLTGTDDPTTVGTALRASFFVLSIVLGLAVYALLRRWIDPLPAMAATSLVTLHTSTVFVSDIAFAELPFTLVTVLFFLVAARKETTRREVLAGLLAVAAYLLRTTGIALLVAWVGGVAWRRQWRRAVWRLAVAAVAVATWQAYAIRVERDPAYATPAYAYQRADYLFYNVNYAHNVTLRNPDRPDDGRVSGLGLAARAGRNLLAAPRHAGETVTAVRDDWKRGFERLRRLPVVGGLFPPALLDVSLYVLGLLVVAGLVRRLFEGEAVLPLYVFLYVGAICLTPWTYSDRYWIPLAPMLLLGLIHLVLWSGRELRRRGRTEVRLWGGRLLAVVIAAVLSVQVTSLVKFFRQQHQPVAYVDRRGEPIRYRLFYYRDTYRALDEAIDWLRRDAPADAIVAASMPHWVYLRSGLKAVMPPFESNPVEALRLLETVPVDYLLVDGRTGSYTREFGLPAVRLAPERWTSVLADREGDVEVYRRVR